MAIQVNEKRATYSVNVNEYANKQILSAYTYEVGGYVDMYMIQTVCIKL